MFDALFRCANAFTTRPAVVPAIIGCLLLAACAQPTGVKFLEPSLDASNRVPILVATSRQPLAQPTSKADFSGERGDKLSFASYDISIPPTHKVGQIEWPSNKPDPKRHFAVASARSFDTDKAFATALNKRINAPGAQAADGKREAMLFVHGYNTDFSEGLYRTAQMKHDFELPFPLTLFSWPSAGKPELYMYDRDSVKASRDHLAHVIDLLARSKSDQVTLVAHSLGTELLMETLRQMALSNNGRLPKKIGAVILISPDLDMDVFNSQLDTIKTLPRDFAIFVSKHDQALALSSFLTGDNGRLGNTIDETKIKRGGIQVIDVSGFGGGDEYNHMTAITSPGLVSILKGLAHSGQSDMLKEQGKTSSLSEKVVGTATLPFTLVVRTTKAIFNPD